MAEICKIKHYCYLGSRYNRQEFSEKPSSGERGGGICPTRFHYDSKA
ncbi:hypothetical protein PORCRE_92 [Porphyromonas crevioricanis JCM 15906]|uniref:Uncharacterized protein n=1 Tax=Porphyromonas crevioricanis JCM 15906 TaxID=1305617 RepID=S4N6L0_9PORP|nr:hypothetical protein PORCRE_92 [Porphyromonas crevioricanis JCM 15906]